MSTEFMILLIQLSAQYAPGWIDKAISLIKTEKAPTLDQLTALSTMVKKGEAYFEG